MRRNLRLVFLAAVALACSRGEKSPAGSTTAAAPPSTTSVSTPAAGAPQPITGKTWDVKMLGDDRGYRFEPASLTIRRGDGIRWTVVSGLPHNVTFWPDSIPAGASGVLQGNMTLTTAPLTGPLLLNLSQTYAVSFAGVPSGTYRYYCTPHLTLGMKGAVVVQ